MGHVPGAVRIDWQGDLQDQIIRDYINREKFTELCSRNGIAPDTTVVFYGDKSNWWACYAFWAFTLFGHKNCKVMNGGRKLWIDQGRPLSNDVPQYPATKYAVAGDNEAGIRAFRDDVLAHMKAGKPLIDVRSPKEFTGEMLHMEDYPQEGALRGGHIPGARTSPGPEPSTKTARSSPPRSSGRYTRRSLGSSRVTTSWPTAGSASGRA